MGKEIDYTIRCIKSLKDEIDCSNGVPDHDYSTALEIAIKSLEMQKKMIEHCEGSCDGCNYCNRANTAESECMNDFIVSLKN